MKELSHIQNDNLEKRNELFDFCSFVEISCSYVQYLLESSRRPIYSGPTANKEIEFQKYEMDSAALIIQSHYRGFLTRKRNNQIDLEGVLELTLASSLKSSFEHLKAFCFNRS